jgi:hypothetical protein
MNKSCLFLAFATFSFFSCNNTPDFEKEAICHANKIADFFESYPIVSFREWNYGQRGQNEYWQKRIRDSVVYSCIYSKRNDTSKISCSNLKGFKTGFGLKINIDSALFSQYSFELSNDSSIRISIQDTLGRTHVYPNSMACASLFEQENPFVSFSKLSQLKNKLGVTGIVYMPQIGDFIQFNFSPDYVLTYLPDSCKFSPKYSSLWKSEFEKGMMIRKNWNLRKLYPK